MSGMGRGANTLGGGGGFRFGGDGFGATQSFNAGGGRGLFDFMGSKNFGNFMDLGSLALNAYGMNKSLGFAEDQLGLMKDQENRAATAQNFSTGNSLAMALQATTPGTPEHERVKQAIAQGSYQV